MKEVIHQSYEGMRACARSDDGQCSVWFEVAQGLHQGCLLFLLLFNGFFAATLLMTLERFSEDADIFKNSRPGLAPKRHRNVRGVLGGLCMLMTCASCHGPRAGWNG